MASDPSAEIPQISIVIPTRNRPAHLAECLDAVARAKEGFRVEVLVMDQSDGEATRDVAVRPLGVSVRYQRMPRPGACPARNLGAALARAPIVSFLDDDCCPRSDWISRILSAFERDPALSFICGQLKAPPDADLARGSYPEFLPSREWQRRRSRRRIIMVSAGANMSARKEFLLRIGGFDELLGPDHPTVKGNDSSIAYKVLASGERWDADPDIEVIHKNGFREHAEISKLYAGYDHGLGVNWARFVRRGDLKALLYFALEHAEMTRPILGSVLRLERPHMSGWFAHIAGFIDGIRLPGAVGFVDGNELRRMAATGLLDARSP